MLIIQWGVMKVCWWCWGTIASSFNQVDSCTILPTDPPNHWKCFQLGHVILCVTHTNVVDPRRRKRWDFGVQKWTVMLGCSCVPPIAFKLESNQSINVSPYNDHGGFNWGGGGGSWWAVDGKSVLIENWAPVWYKTIPWWCVWGYWSLVTLIRNV